MDLTALWYAVTGLIGGVIFVLMPPMVTDLKTIIQHIVLGAIVGVISWLILLSQAATSIGTPLSYIATITAGYLAIDFLKNFLGSSASSYPTGDTNIPK